MNFVELGDLSWNPGERVEGYTEPLHVFLLSFLVWLGSDPIFAAQGLNAFCAVTLALAVFTGVRLMRPGEPVGIIEAFSLCALLSSPPLVIWVFGGLGSLLAASLSAWALVILIPVFRDTNPPLSIFTLCSLSGVVLGISYLARPDAVVFAAAAGLSVLLSANAKLRQRFGGAFLLGSVCSVFVIAHVAWRYAYYGEFLPNTYYAKVGLDRSVRWLNVPDYLSDSFLIYLMPTTLGIIGMLALLTGGRTHRIAVLLLVPLVLHTAYVAWSGGDHMPAARVLLPIMAPGCLLLALSLQLINSKWRPIVATVAMIPLLFAAMVAPRIFEDGASWVGSIVGPYIHEAWPEDALVASNSAGALVFFAREKKFIDMLGLNDRAIGKREDIEFLAPKQSIPGHSKGDGAYVLSRKPDYIIVGRAQGVSSEKAWFLTGYELHRMQEFHDCYVLNEVEIDLERLENPLPFVFYERSCEK